ncbi:MAG: glycerophosphodiester phosphodiesterase [Planctomycetota bacterium]
MSRFQLSALLLTTLGCLTSILFGVSGLSGPNPNKEVSLIADANDPHQKNFIVIAHRGASGYLPEHTFAAYALAHGMGADFIEQDLVLTKDDQVVVLHDIHLDTVTDVSKQFPDRGREDGRFYAVDFTLEEIKSLRVHERVDHETGKSVFSERFPSSTAVFQIPTLQEAIELVEGMNQSTGRSVGLYPEIKKPAWHRSQGKDISSIVLKTLKEHGYTFKSDNIYLQCFDPLELKRIRNDLDCQLKLVQLIGSNDWTESQVDYNQLVTESGLKDIAKYADGIGPWMPYIVDGVSADGKPQMTKLVQWAKQNHLAVHPFTFRADSLPDYADSFDELMVIFKFAGVDGVFTDHCDRAIDHAGGKN